MTKEKKYELIPASTLKKIKEDVEDVGDQKHILKNLEKKIELLSKRVEKSLEINIELQEKVSELMLHLTELIENIQKMASLPRETSAKMQNMGKPKTQGKENISEELLLLAKQNKELTKTLRTLEEQLKKDEIREAIRKAIAKARTTK